MRVKVDEDLPPAVAELLRKRGHEAESVVDEGLGGWKDADLWATVQREGRFLVTADKGFADIRSHPPGGHAGVLLLRPEKDGIAPIMELLRLVLERSDLGSLERTISIATPRCLRIRRT